MARFYFHLRDDINVLDDEGRELPGNDAARAYASEIARFELSEAVKREGRIKLQHRIDIEDEQHRVVDSVWFRDVLKVES